MANRVSQTDYPKNQKQILINDIASTEVSIIVSDAGVTAVDGRKIVKAGQIMYGDILDRDTAMTITGTDIVGILLHDTDVTAGPENKSLVIDGTVDILKLDSDIQALYDAAMVKTLRGLGIKAIKGRI